jgi:hypothetical protein
MPVLSGSISGFILSQASSLLPLSGFREPDRAGAPRYIDPGEAAPNGTARAGERQTGAEPLPVAKSGRAQGR